MSKLKDGLTFSEALFYLSREEFKMMRWKNPDTNDFDGDFYFLIDGSLSIMVGKDLYESIDLKIFDITKLTSPNWQVNSPMPPNGWLEAYDNSWYKPIIVDCWINIYYNYKNHELVRRIYEYEGLAKLDAEDFCDNTFIFTRHLQQQCSVPWRE